MLRKSIARIATATTMLALGIVVTELPASAGHTHYVLTPNGECHQVAQGQTSISDTDDGGYHQFHDHVHLGATGDSGTEGDDNLGQGNGEAAVYKEGPAPAVCDGD